MEKEFLDRRLNKECDKIYDEILKIEDDGSRRIVEDVKLISTLEIWTAIFKNDRDIVIRDGQQHILDMLGKLVADKTIVVKDKDEIDDPDFVIGSAMPNGDKKTTYYDTKNKRYYEEVNKSYYDKDREFYLSYVDRFLYAGDKDGYMKSLVDELKCLKSYKRRVNKGSILNVKDLNRGNVLVNELKKLGMSEKESGKLINDMIG